MGTTRKLGFGYGIKFTPTKRLQGDADEVCDIEALIEDYYPLLQYDGAGNAWSESTQDLILVKELSVSDYDVYTIEVSGLIAGEPSPEALVQMKAFCEKYGLQFTPGWLVFNYSG